MIWNGKEIGRWQIPTTSPEHYKEVFGKLRKLGFVFTEDRMDNADAILQRYMYDYPYFVIGYHGHEIQRNPCKMMLTGFRNPDENYVTMDVDEWIAKCWPAYDAA